MENILPEGTSYEITHLIQTEMQCYSKYIYEIQFKLQTKYNFGDMTIWTCVYVYVCVSNQILTVLQLNSLEALKAIC